jgi:hypothetical protein
MGQHVGDHAFLQADLQRVVEAVEEAAECGSAPESQR